MFSFFVIEQAQGQHKSASDLWITRCEAQLQTNRDSKKSKASIRLKNFEIS